MTFTVDIAIRRDWRFRIAFALMRLAGWFMGMAVKAVVFRPKILIRRPGGRWDAFDNEAEADRFRKQLGDNENTTCLDAFNVTYWTTHIDA